LYLIYNIGRLVTIKKGELFIISTENDTLKQKANNKFHNTFSISFSRTTYRSASPSNSRLPSSTI